MLHKEINNTSLYRFLILYLLSPQLEHFIIFCSGIAVVEKKLSKKRAIKQDKLIHGHEQKVTNKKDVKKKPPNEL